MTCTYESIEKMAAAGWSQDEIEQLEKEVELARRKAEAASFSDGDTLVRQRQRIKAAEKAARDVAHDRFHRKLEDGMKAINALNAFVASHPGEHYSEEVAVKALAAGGQAGHKHLTTSRKGA